MAEPAPATSGSPYVPSDADAIIDVSGDKGGGVAVASATSAHEAKGETTGSLGTPREVGTTEDASPSRLKGITVDGAADEGDAAMPPTADSSGPAETGVSGEADDPRWFEGMTLVSAHGVRTGVSGYESSVFFYHIPRVLGVYFFAMAVIVGVMFGVSAGLRTIYGFVRTPAPPIKCDWTPMAGSELSAADTFRPFVISDPTADQGKPNTLGDDILSVLVIWCSSSTILLLYGGWIASAWTLMVSALRGRELIELKRFDLAPWRKPDEEPGSHWWDVTVQVLYHGMVCTAPVLCMPIAYVVEGNLGDAVGVGVTLGLISAAILAGCHETLMIVRLIKLLHKAFAPLKWGPLGLATVHWCCCCLAAIPGCRARASGGAAASDSAVQLHPSADAQAHADKVGPIFYQVASANIVTNFYFDDEQGGALTCRNRPAGRRQTRQVLGRHNVCFRINQLANHCLGWLGLRAPWFLFFSRFTLLMAIVFAGSFESVAALAVLLPWIAAAVGIVVVSCMGHQLLGTGCKCCCSKRPVGDGGAPTPAGESDGSDSPAARIGAGSASPKTESKIICSRVCGGPVDYIRDTFESRNRIANAAGWLLLVLAFCLSFGYDGGMDAALTQWGTFCTMMSSLCLLYGFSETAARTLVEDRRKVQEGSEEVTGRNSGAFRPSRFLDTFWNVWQSLAVVFVVLFVYGAGWTEQENTDGSGVFPRGPSPVPPDTNTTVRPYSVCADRWGPAALDFDIVDAAHMARLAYSTNGNVTRDLNLMFGRRNATHALSGDWKVVQPRAVLVDKPTSLLGDDDDDAGDALRTLSQFYIFNNNRHNFSVVAVRGTTVERDWIQNANVWGEVVLLQAFSYIFPMGFWPEKTIQAIVDWEWLVASLQSWAVELPEMRYICEIRKGLDDALRKGAMHADFIVVGHSLGGGLAKIVGTRLGAPSVSLSGPGLYQTRRKFGLTLEALGRLVTQITPRFDVVARVDWDEGATQHIACYNTAKDPSVVDCHSVASTVCELAHVCGDPLARNVKTNHAGPCFDTAEARTKRVSASGRFVPV